MTITPIVHPGNSSKFHIVTKRGEFDIALSFTLRTKLWQITDIEILSIATELAEAIVSRHNPELPFKKLYIFAEHNVQPTYEQTLQYIRKNGL